MGKESYNGNSSLLFFFCKTEADRQYLYFLLTHNRGKLDGGRIEIIYTEDECS